MLDVKPLRDRVERKSDERTVARRILPRVLERARQQRPANAIALAHWIDEQFRKEPEILTDPTERGADDLPVRERDE